MYLQAVKNASVWRSLKILFMGSLLIFLISIFLGFDNAVSSGAIPRWQLLTHLHGGSVGWITLSAIGIAIWLVTGRRDVDSAYERRVRLLTWAGVILFACYVPSFAVLFSNPSGPFAALLPIFGTGTVLTLWAATIFIIGQLRRQPVLSTIHLLITGALLTASIGATVGMLLGLENVIGRFLPLPQGDRVGAHAAMMDTYLFLVAATVVEWATRKQEARWTWPGLLQGLFWTVGAILVPLGFFLNIVQQVLPVFMLLLLLGMVIFLARFGWRALARFSGGPGVTGWAFMGTLWLIVYMGLFLYMASQFAAGATFADLPRWMPAVFSHAGFVGMMTNLLLAVVASRAQERADVWPWAEPAALWVINGGLLLFAALKIAADIRLGAIVMGLGVLLGVATMLRRLQAARETSVALSNP